MIHQPNQERYLTVFFVSLVIGLLAIVVGFTVFMPRMIPSKNNSVSEPTVVIGGTPIAVAVASTDAAREQGLSGRQSLAPNQGMLFVFQQNGNWGFWMKDMEFSLDIIWADEAGKVVSVWQSLSPNTYPRVFYPASPARYVLEVPAGFAALHHIATGTQMTVPSGV